MRLIDADALKSELIAFYADSAELFNEVSCLVDSAKTAEKIPELANAQTERSVAATSAVLVTESELSSTYQHCYWMR